MGDRFSLTLQALAATFFGVVTILALAELIKLVIDIEHNTRLAALRANGVETAAATATVTTTTPEGTTETTAVPAGGVAHVNRVTELDEESAEAALLRGH
jgi:hypothetical protein